MATLDSATVTTTAPTEISLTFEQLFRAVPPVVRAYILSSQFNKSLLDAYHAAKLDEASQSLVGDEVLDVFLGARPLADFGDAVWSALPWDEKEEPRARQLAVDILGLVMLPASPYLGDVAAVIRELGGKPESYQPAKLPTREVAYGVAVEDLLHTVDPNRDWDLDQRDRLAQILESQLRGQRSIEQTVERLMRTWKTGGLDLNEQQSSAIAALTEGQKLLTSFTENPIPEPEESEPAEEEEVEVEHTYTPEEIRSIYAGSTDEQLKIRAAVSAFTDDTTAVATAFAASTTLTDPWQRLGAIFALAQRGTLLAAAKSSPVYADTIRNYFSAQHRQSELAAFNANPIDPQFLNIYLQIALKRFAGFSEPASARYAVRIANLLKKSGLSLPDLAAFDPETGDFRWVTPM